MVLSDFIVKRNTPEADVGGGREFTAKPLIVVVGVVVVSSRCSVPLDLLLLLLLSRNSLKLLRVRALVEEEAEEL